MTDSDHKILRTREERLAFARSMNLFSTPFMREVFKDDKATQYKDLPDTFIFYISMNDFLGLNQPIALVKSTIGNENKLYDDGKHIFFVNAGVDDDSEVAKLMNYFKNADPNDLSHGELSDRVHLLKCEKEGEDSMCAITQSFIDEGKVIGAVQILRDVVHMSDEQIIEEIMNRFQLNEYQAKTFVCSKDPVKA